LKIRTCGQGEKKGREAVKKRMAGLGAGETPGQHRKTLTGEEFKKGPKERPPVVGTAASKKRKGQ